MKRVSIIAILVISLIVGATGCAPKREPAEVAVKNAIEAYKNYDVNKMRIYWGSDVMDVDAVEDAEADAIRALLGGMAYEIVGSQESNNTAVVDVKITNTDMSAVMADVFAEVFPTLLAEAFMPEDAQKSEEEISQLFLDTLLELAKKPEYAKVTNTAQVTLTLKNDAWIIDDGNDAVIDAMMGGISSFSNAVSEAFGDSIVFDNSNGAAPD